MAETAQDRSLSDLRHDAAQGHGVVLEAAGGASESALRRADSRRSAGAAARAGRDGGTELRHNSGVGAFGGKGIANHWRACQNTLHSMYFRLAVSGGQSVGCQWLTSKPCRESSTAPGKSAPVSPRP